MHPLYSFRCPFRVCGLDYPFTPKGACRLVSTPSLAGLARDYRIQITDLGFPEFDRYHLEVSPQAALDKLTYHLDLANLVP